MTRATVRRLGAAGLLFGCLVALPGQAGADDAQKLSIAGPTTITEGGDGDVHDQADRRGRTLTPR